MVANGAKAWYPGVDLPYMVRAALGAAERESVTIGRALGVLPRVSTPRWRRRVRFSSSSCTREGRDADDEMAKRAFRTSTRGFDW